LHRGELYNFNLVLDPTSCLAAVRYPNGSRIRVYYQDLNDDLIRGLYQPDYTREWHEGGRYKKAVKGSSIAVVHWGDANGPHHLSIFYQDPELRLREYLLDFCASRWVYGDFNPGVQPSGTPISAEVVRGGNVDITVVWRDAYGRAASSSWSKSSGWNLPNRPNDGSQLLYKPASPSDSLPNFVGSINHPLTTVSWENGKEIRIYSLDSKGTLQGYVFQNQKTLGRILDFGRENPGLKSFRRPLKCSLS